MDDMVKYMYTKMEDKIVPPFCDFNISPKSKMCYVCGSISDSMESLLNVKTAHSHTSFPEKLGTLVGDMFSVFIKPDDVICNDCTCLFNSMDKLELDLSAVRAKLWNYLVVKYNLIDVDVNNAQTLDSELINEEENKRKRTSQYEDDDIINKKIKCSEDTDIVAVTKIVANSLIEIKSDDSKQDSRDKFNSKRFFCEECTNCFTTISDFRNHLKEHKIFSCRYCRHPFSNYAKLKTHLLTCELAKKETSPLLSGTTERYRCERCGIMFLYAQSYKRHMDMSHNDNSNKLKNKESNDESIQDETMQSLSNSSSIESKYSDSKNISPELEQDNIYTQTIQIIDKTIAVKDELEEICISDTKFEIPIKGSEKDKTNCIAKMAELKRIYECQFCRYKTSVDAEMKEHIETHDKKRLFCEICDITFSKRSTFCKHISNHTLSPAPSKCTACGVKCQDELHLKMHMVSLHPGQPTCSLCNEKFTSGRALHTHRKINHPKEYDYSCTICNKSFTREVILRNHVEYEHREERKCKICGKEINNIKRLRFHEQRHMRDAHHVWECEHCEKKFKTKAGLKFHTAQHTGDYKLFCEICGRGFMSSVILKEHMGVHTREERYICDVCGQKFCFNATYRVHRMWHDNPLPYQCKICNQKFSHTSLLAVHRRRVHTMERPYCCKFCELTFTCSSSLKRHERVHTGERPHVCQLCNRGFIEKKAWAKHLAIDHDDYTEINKKRTCEYKMVIKPDITDSTEITEAPEIIDEDSNIDVKNASIITIHNPDDDTNDESMLIYDTATLVDEKTSDEIKVAIARGYQIIKAEDGSDTLLEGIDENSLVIETEEGHQMVLHNGHFVALKTD